MNFQKIIGVFGVLALMGVASPSRAEWRALERDLGYGQGAAGCAEGGYQTACLAVRCEAGASAQLALIGAGYDFRAGRETPVYLQVDRGPVYEWRMQPGNGRRAAEAFLDYDSARHADFLNDIRHGQVLRIGLWRRDSLRDAPRISLRGASRALDAAFSQCGGADYARAGGDGYGTNRQGESGYGGADWSAPPIDPSASRRWERFSGFRAGARYCAVQGKWDNACLTLSCEPDSPLELEIILQGTIGGWATTGVSRIEAAFSVDGWHADTIQMQRSGYDHDAQVFRTLLSPSLHGRLLEALSRGNTAGLTLSGNRGRVDLGLGLAGSAKAISAALDACPYDTGYRTGSQSGYKSGQDLGQGSGHDSGYAAPEAHNPSYNSGAVSAYTGERPGRVATHRFVPLFDGRRNLSMEDVAHRLMAQDLDQIGANALLITTSLSLPGGQTLLSVVLGPSTQLYGETGTGTVLWVVGDGSERRVYGENGVAVWADQEHFTGGMPDLWVQPMQGVNEPYALWRWTGRDYSYSESIAP
jgi:hypothetical protein